MDVELLPFIPSRKFRLPVAEQRNSPLVSFSPAKALGSADNAVNSSVIEAVVLKVGSGVSWNLSDMSAFDQINSVNSIFRPDTSRVVIIGTGMSARSGRDEEMA